MIPLPPLNPELANPYVLPVFDAIGPYLLPLVIVSAIAAYWIRAARMVFGAALITLAVYLVLCLRLYPK